MKIREVKISNILSFPYVENIDNMDGINFEKQIDNLDMNIFIWANGSGKSNFIEIINQFSRNLLLDYTFNPSIITNRIESEYKNAIKLISRSTSKLSKHSKFQDKPSHIQIKIELFDNDYSNIQFVCKNIKKINKILDKYSELKYRLPQFKYEHIKDEIKEIWIKAEFDEKKQEFIINKPALTPMEFFSLVCIQEQELLYICMDIYNKHEKRKNDKPRYPLKNTFCVLSSWRNLIERKYLNNLQDFDEYVFKNKNEINPNLEWYYRCLQKIRSIIKKRTQNDIEWVHADENIYEDSREKRLYNSDFRKQLSRLVKRFINKTLSIEYVQWWINFLLKNPEGDPCYFDDLWMWQQSLLLIIFSLIGNDLENWFMIIDEPELHIHPQLQKEISVLFNQLSEKYGTQFFLSTYSALFINEENITNVYRFSKDYWWTKIFTPNIRIASDDAWLVHLLRYENLSKIFFVNKIIMVEWDSDSYFFSHYLKRLQKQPWREYITWTYEIININWKWSYKSWHRFLNKFWIDNYFIWDWDNTVDYGFFTSKELWRYYQLANKFIKTIKWGNWDYYNRLVFTIKKYYPQKYQRIIDWIENLYKDNVYILKLWAIESYPCRERKGLQYMVNFCNSEFNYRLINPNTNEQRKELFDIFWHIFSKEKKLEDDNIENPF